MMFDMYIFVVFPIVSQKVREIFGTININKLIIYQRFKRPLKIRGMGR